MNIIQQWNDFKTTWYQKLDKSELHLFYEFDNFITTKLQNFEKKNRNNTSVVKRIYIFNKPVNKISFKNGILYIYESPFHIIVKEKKSPCALFLENIILSIIKFIENNSVSTIKIIKLRNYNEEGKEEEEEEEEEEKE